MSETNVRVKHRLITFSLARGQPSNNKNPIKSNRTNGSSPRLVPLQTILQWTCLTPSLRVRIYLELNVGRMKKECITRGLLSNNTAGQHSPNRYLFQGDLLLRVRLNGNSCTSNGQRSNLTRSILTNTMTNETYTISLGTF
jgi:hypothetical protein